MDNIIISKAEFKDAEGVFELLEYWYNNYIDGDRKLGHLHCTNKYTKAIVERFITESYVSVAKDEQDKILSFYLINHFFDIGNIQSRIGIVNQMIDENKLPQGRYAFRLAAATDKDFTGRGLNKKCLKYLQELAKSEYDFFIGVMDYDNIATHKSSLRMGWKNIGDIGIGLLAIIGTTELNNNLLNNKK